MTYQPLGTSALHISTIGFGCMSLGQDAALNQSLIAEALSLGINYFDTADLYDKGANEVTLGNAVKERRKEVVIATKVGNQWRPDGSGWDWNPTKAYILNAVEKSLQRLQTDYIDLYQLHGGTIEDPIAETIDAFETLVQQGKIRYYGISSMRPNVIQKWVARARPVSVMLPYSLLDRRAEETVLPLLQQKHISVLARGTLAQGLLAGKPPQPYLEHSAQAVQKAANGIQQLSGTSRMPVQTALQFVFQQGGITSAVVGIRTRQQLLDAVQTISTPPLTAAEIKLLQELAPAGNYAQHR